MTHPHATLQLGPLVTPSQTSLGLLYNHMIYAGRMKKGAEYLRFFLLPYGACFCTKPEAIPNTLFCDNVYNSFKHAIETINIS